MNDKFGLKESDLKNIISIFKGQSEVEEAIIFGSRAKGNFRNGSDVDIAVKGSLLNFKLISRLSFLLNEETLMPYHFDLLQYNTVSNRNLRSHIDRAGIPFYSKVKVLI